MSSHTQDIKFKAGDVLEWVNPPQSFTVKVTYYGGGDEFSGDVIASNYSGHPVGTTLDHWSLIYGKWKNMSTELPDIDLAQCSCDFSKGNWKCTCGVAEAERAAREAILQNSGGSITDTMIAALRKEQAEHPGWSLYGSLEGFYRKFVRDFAEAIQKEDEKGTSLVDILDEMQFLTGQAKKRVEKEDDIPF